LTRFLQALLAMLVLLPAVAAAGAPQMQHFERAEAARSSWDAAGPPETGWTQVQLLDIWDTRWPHHDGVVWYRVRWQQADAHAPTGLLVSYMSLTGAIYVNGSLVARAPSLVEPLSRSWNRPDYFLLDAPLLRQGENTLLVRVSGLARYQPGFGDVRVGAPERVHAEYRREMFERFQIKLINVAMSAVLGAIFLLIWLLRRQDTTFGWFALSELVSSVYGANFIVSSPWPFSSSDGWQAFIAATYVAAGTCYAVFLLRFCGRRFRVLERAMAATCIAAFALALLAPGWMGPHRVPWFVAGGMFYYVSMGWFLVKAWRTPRLDYRVLAACLLVPILVSFRDFALFFGWIRGDTYLLALTSVLTLIGIGFVLAFRFVMAMRRVEGFNLELRREVAAATGELGQTLQREHALALAHSRAGERLQLVRDLHDGFGGTLVGAIAQLEQAPEATSKRETVAMLKEMREDLRLVIDSTAHEHADLPLVLAPLRHRASRLLEAAGIEDHWQLQDVEGVDLGGARNLDLLRLLQEALTNVFKHSQANRVEVRLECTGGNLTLCIRDDGKGIAPGGSTVRPATGGAGFASMRLRAARLGGQLQVQPPANGTGTELRLAFPLVPIA
jgi:signal transduction histidine kinase